MDDEIEPNPYGTHGYEGVPDNEITAEWWTSAAALARMELDTALVRIGQSGEGGRAHDVKLCIERAKAMLTPGVPNPYEDVELRGSTVGQIAFEAYSDSVGGRTHDAKPIPPWASLTNEVRFGWEKAALASVLAAVAIGQQLDAKGEQ